MVQGNDWSNVGKLVFKSSISLLSVVALNQVNESNSWKRAFQHSISRCPEQSKLIELLKTSFPTFDQSLPWTKKTNRTLENELSNIWWFRATTDRMLESSSFKSSIRFLGSGQRLIECWKAHFQEFDSFTWFRAITDRMLESSFSRIRFVFLVQGNDWSNVGKLISRVRFVFLVQGNDWSNVGKLIFKSSIRFLGSGQRLIECWKARFQEFDSFSWFRATTDRMLESSFSRVRFVFLVQGNDWSNVGKLIFKSSIRFLGSGQWLIECWKARFQEFDSFLGSGQRLIECWKAHFQEFDSFSSVVALNQETNRILENELSNIRSVIALNQENESNSWKWAFQHSISRCPEPRKRIKLLKMSFPTFDQSLPWTKKTNQTLENDLSNIRSVLALNQENESNSWKWAFQHSMVQSNDWSNVGKLVFKSLIRLLGSGQRLMEC